MTLEVRLFALTSVLATGLLEVLLLLEVRLVRMSRLGLVVVLRFARGASTIASFLVVATAGVLALGLVV